jgi:hypothetical protein
MALNIFRHMQTLQPAESFIGIGRPCNRQKHEYTEQKHYWESSKLHPLVLIWKLLVAHFVKADPSGKLRLTILGN